MKLKKCISCQVYTLKEICPQCKSKTSDAHYKFIKINSKVNDKNNLRDREIK